MLTSFHIFPANSPIPFVFCGALAFFGFPLVNYIGRKLNYARTEYRFYPDRLEFEEGFFTINKKVIKFKDVKEITLNKNIFQRVYNLGTIYVATLATGSSFPGSRFFALGFGNISASGASVQDIQNPDETYEEIRRIVDAHNDRAS